MVVFHHAAGLFATQTGANSHFAEPQLLGAFLQSFDQLFASGVDIFFVLSGFIMVYIADPYVSRRKTIGDFAVRRILRIYPTYLILDSRQTQTYFQTTATRSRPMMRRHP
jgi:peptidoglycan/LPS O-acetylase OafA/YrhL